MKTAAIAVFAAFAVSLLAQTAPTPSSPDPWAALQFLEGNWEAKGQGGGGASATGSYRFTRELGGHILARHSRSNGDCQGPAQFDCDHGDLLYVYQDMPGAPLKAIYFDNEGHVIHYEVTTPRPRTVVFLSSAAQPGPQFRLSYEQKDAVMSGKFQMKMPGQTEWKSYLEWSGGAAPKQQ